jgi:hypothetical protein
MGEPLSPRELAIARTPDDEIVALYHPCSWASGQLVEAIRLIDVQTRTLRATKYIVLWEVRANPPRRLEEFTVGQVPEGFSETLNQLPPSFQDINPAIDVFGEGSTGTNGAGLSFDWDDLEHDRFRDDRQDYHTKDEFLALDPCKQ